MYFRLSGVTEMEQVEEEETKLDPALSLTEEDVGQFVPVGPASGPDVVPRLLQGVRVVKGPDWKWGDQVRSFPSSLVSSLSSFLSSPLYSLPSPPFPLLFSSLPPSQFIIIMYMYMGMYVKKMYSLTKQNSKILVLEGYMYIQYVIRNTMYRTFKYRIRTMKKNLMAIIVMHVHLHMYIHTCSRN